MEAEVRFPERFAETFAGRSAGDAWPAVTEVALRTR